MAIDIFAYFSTPSVPSIQIPDSTLDPRSKGIKIETFSMGLENVINIGSATGGAGAGKATFNPIVITKVVDANTPSLVFALVSGSHYTTVTFDFFNSATAKPTGSIYSIACKLVAISNIEQAVSQGDDTLIEEITLQYGAIQVKSKAQNKDGTLGKEMMMQWSKVKNNNSFDV